MPEKTDNLTDAKFVDDDEIVIAGVAGAYPQSESIIELQHNLYNKIDMITPTLAGVHPEVPKRLGVLKQAQKFDAEFFNISDDEAQSMDPGCRMILEKAFEAVVDAGLHPDDLNSTNTRVYVGASFSETERMWFFTKNKVDGHGIVGCSRAALANRISYWLNLSGPSCNVDTACSSYLYALEMAYRDLRNEVCDYAIVGTANLCLSDIVTLQFYRLGVLSQDGHCRTFDELSSGYVRSEAVGVVILTKAKYANRIYGQIVHTKTNCDGYKPQGITFPSSERQKLLLTETYEECKMSPTCLSYLETHGTGTVAGDIQETNSIDEIFCKLRKKPLLIGSVKTNLGHSEPASGLCSLSKVILTMETGIIPPNLHFVAPRKDIVGLVEGRMKVVSENTPLSGDFVGINGFGFGGGNAHVVLKRFLKTKVNNGLPKDDLPRLVTFSGRTLDAVKAIVDDLSTRQVDAEYVRLFHNIYRKNIDKHYYRGYVIVQKSYYPHVLEQKMQSINYTVKRPVWYIIGGLGSQWPGMGTGMLDIPIVKQTVTKLSTYLEPYNVDLFKILTDSKISNNIDSNLNTVVGLTAMQIALIDLLSELGIEPDHIVGYSTGELACAYADNCLTAEETILTAYYLGLNHVIETKSENEIMVICDINSNELVKICPPQVDFIGKIHNDSSIISGPTDLVRPLISKLASKGISSQEMALNNGTVTNGTDSSLKYELRQFLPDRKFKFNKWVPPGGYNETKQFSLENFKNNVNKHTHFIEELKNIELNATIIEISPNSLLHQTINGFDPIKSKDVVTIMESKQNNINPLLSALGRLYLKGLNPQLEKIYPEVKFPVSRGTPMISHLVKWDHSKDYHVFRDSDISEQKNEEKNFLINVKDPKFENITGHIIDGRNLYPATGYLVLAWETLATTRDQLVENISVMFEDVRFLRATHIPKEGYLEMSVMIQKGTGYFEISEHSSIIVSGYIKELDKGKQHLLELEPIEPIVTDELLPMKIRDIYKDLRLRGYNYQDKFKSLLETDNSELVAEIQWHDDNDWIAFMDTMLQVKILQESNQFLYLPTKINKVIICPNMHKKFIKRYSDDKNSVTVTNYKDYKIIKGGGVEIHGLQVTSINRRRPLGEAILEKQVFTPFISQQRFKLNDALRVMLQLALENNPGIRVKVVEIHDEAEYFLAETIYTVLNDLPLIQSEVTVITQKELKDFPKNIIIKDKKTDITKELSAFVVGSNLVNNPKKLKDVSKALKTDDGFIISRENPHIKPNSVENYDTIIELFTEDEKLVLLRKKKLTPIKMKAIKISQDTEFKWLQSIQDSLNDNEHLVVYCQNEPINGLIGFVNCLLKEPNGTNVKGVFIDDVSAPKFDLNNSFYKDQLDKGLRINMYKNGVWGCLRHLKIDETTVDSSKVYMSFATRGDLSSLTWYEVPTIDSSENFVPVYIYYSALNFRDVMTASGKLSFDYIAQSLNDECNLPQDVVQGLEFSGRDVNGERYMGIANRGALASFIEADKYLLWRIPDSWSMEDAATVPIVYSTVYYSLVIYGITSGKSVLIHSGTGGVGLAAINVALHFDCEIFVTVGTEEKKKFLMEMFPQIKESHIGNSRDTSFEQIVMENTDGKGVDFILNSLAEEKLMASVRCLAEHGKFLEIGKFDLANDNKLGMEVFLRGASYHGIMLDNTMTAAAEVKLDLNRMVKKGLEDGVIKPLPRKVYDYSDGEKALRYMAAGKHIGKVLLKFRDEETERTTPPSKLMISSVPRVYCKRANCVVIIGGLGGFGLELTSWLIMRGCRKIVLSSRQGLKKGYQSTRVQKWRSSGVNVIISTANISTKEGCMELLSTANKLGPVEAIYNLAVILRDALIENQTVDNFQTSFAGKALGTQYLDEVSRILCPELKYFVVFSSVSCGRGNAGQTNYGMANSVMERVCEKRRAEGYPAIAIQWGAIGDVGLVADMQENDQLLEIGGTLQQSLNSCLATMDVLMKQSEPVVASMVVAEKKYGFGAGGNLVETIFNIVGVRDIKKVSNQSTLAELGMDSMMAVEIKQTLEREFELFLTPQDVRNLTLAKLTEIQTSTASETPSEKIVKSEEQDILKLFIHTLGTEGNSDAPIIKLDSLATETDQHPPIFLFPGIEGQGSVFKTLCQHLKQLTYSLQISFSNTNENISELVLQLLPHIKSKLKPNEEFNFIAYSYGCVLATELALILEKDGYKGRCLFIDGSPYFVLSMFRDKYDFSNQLPTNLFETNVLLQCLKLMNLSNDEMKNELENASDWNSRLAVVLAKLPSNINYSPEHIRRIYTGLLARFKAIINYEVTEKLKLNSPFKLIRPVIQVSTEFSDDYELSSISNDPNKVSVVFLDGDHYSVLNNPLLFEHINTFFTEELHN